MFMLVFKLHQWQQETVFFIFFIKVKKSTSDPKERKRKIVFDWFFNLMEIGPSEWLLFCIIVTLNEKISKNLLDLVSCNISKVFDISIYLWHTTWANDFNMYLLWLEFMLNQA